MPALIASQSMSYTVELPSEFISAFVKKFQLIALNQSVAAINPLLQVKIISVNDSLTSAKKWFALLNIDNEGDGTISRIEYLSAQEAIRQLTARIICDAPLELPGIQPESLRDHQVLRFLAMREKVSFFITNANQIATEAKHEVATAAVSPPDTFSGISGSSKGVPFIVNNVDTTEYLQSAQLLHDYVATKFDSTIQAIHMAPFYALYPKIREKLHHIKLKDLCAAFPHLLSMKIDPSKKGTLSHVFDYFSVININFQ